MSTDTLTLPDDVVLSVRGVSKKFCRNLKRSMWYGMQDLGRSLVGLRSELIDNRLQTTDHRLQTEPQSLHAEKTGYDASYPQCLTSKVQGIKSNVLAEPPPLRRDEFWALRDINFELKRGECLGLIGANGSGKSTLLRLLAGIFPPDSGEIAVRGRVGALIALGAGFHPHMTGRENIYLNASILGINRKEIAEKVDDIIEFAEIGDFIDAPVSTYSSGMRVRLGFAVATAVKPDLLLIDEVLSVGDAGFRVKCFNRIYEILENTAVIFVSHNMPQVCRICDRLMLLEHGIPVLLSSNMGQIIHKYFDSAAINCKPQLHGGGKTMITNVTVSDHNQSQSSVIHAGKPLTVSVNVKMPAEQAHRDPRLLITINNEEQCNIAQIYERLARLPVRTQSESIIIDVILASVPFNPGRYWVTASILLGTRGELSCVLRNACAFTVYGDYVGYAPVLLTPTLVEPSK